MRTFIAALIVVLAAGSAHAAGKVRVVASFSILADMTARIAGDRADVGALVGPGADAHVFQPSPSEAKQLAGADLVIINGLGFEGWMERLAEAAGYTGRVVVASTGIAPLAAHDGDHENHGHDGEHEDHDHDGHEAHETHDAHDHGDADPHAWQDVANALVYADNIAAGLCAADAEGCAAYRANAAAYKQELAALDEEIKARFAAIAPERRRVITSHEAFGYFARAYGVEMLAPVAVSTDAEPSASDIARLIRQIRQEGVTAMFVETISDARLLQRIAGDTGVAIGGEIYSDSLSHRDGPAPDYVSMMRYNAATIAGALAGS